MVAKEIYDEGMKRLATFDIRSVLPALRSVSEGAMNDIKNTNGCAYYSWTPGLIDLLKPRQVVELGGAMGVWSIMALHNLPEDSLMYSITLPERGLEFAYIADEYPNLKRVLGDDLDTDIWPEDTDLFKTNLWFFDSLHEADHLRKEFDLYSTFFKKGAAILIDDIHSFGLESIWEELCEKYDHYDGTDPLHYSGFGILTI